MFALPFNFPFRKNDGTLTTIADAISSGGGGGGGYELPTATVSRLGGVKVGANLSVAEDGTLSAPAPTPAYELPTASADTLGGVKIGSGITIDANGVISASGGGGGGTKYVHNISVFLEGITRINLIIITNSSTPVTTIVGINNILPDMSETVIPANGFSKPDSAGALLIYAVELTADSTSLRYYHDVGTYSTSTGTVTDFVYSI